MLSCHRSIALVCLLAASSFSLPTRARPGSGLQGAQVDPAGDPSGSAEAAERAFQEGRDAMNRGDLVAACEHFAESHRLERAAGAAINLAACEEKIGKLVSAWKHWREAIELLDPDDERAPFARDRVKILGPRVPYLQVTIPGRRPSEVELLLDGKSVGTDAIDVALPLDPGTYEVTVRAPGYRDQTLEVTLAEGQINRVAVPMGRPMRSKHSDASGEAAPDAEHRRERRPLFYAGVGAGGLGLVGVGAAIVTGLMVQDKRDITRKECDQAKLCSPKGMNAVESGQKLLVLNGVAWGVGVAGLGAGAALVALNWPYGEKRVGIGAVPGGATVTYSGRF